MWAKWVPASLLVSTTAIGSKVVNLGKDKRVEQENTCIKEGGIGVDNI